MTTGGVRKFSKNYGLKVSGGVSYGSLKGFSTTFAESSECTTLVIVTTIPDPEAERALKAELDSANITRAYNVRSIEFNTKTIIVTFKNAIGTMKKVFAFVDYFYPLLKETGASKSKTCAECGNIIEQGTGTWKQVNGIAYHLHKDCAVQLRNELIQEHETERASEKGSYLSGLIGAIIGTVIGSALWAGLYYMGYIASIAGFVIGILAERGYTLLKGKRGAIKVVILILCVIAGVIIGTTGGLWLTLFEMLNDGEFLPSVTAGDLFSILIETLKTSEEAAMSVAKDVGLGALFAALGVFALIKKTASEAGPTKVKDMKE